MRPKSLSEGRKNPEALFMAVNIPRFTAQAISAEREELRGRPFVVVEQNPSSHKTVVLELSEAARIRLREEGREHHLRPGLPVFLVQRKWPGLVIVSRDLAAEARLRDTMRTLWERCTPEFTVRENGGAMLNMTGTPATRKFPPEAWALRLRTELLRLGIEEASLGIASSQVVARVLARLDAQRGVHVGPCRVSEGVRVCMRGGEATLLDPLPPSLLPGLSSHARERLKKYGLETIAAVRSLDKGELTLRFGAEGEKLHVLTRGIDMEPVAPKRKPVVVETLLPLDLIDDGALRNQVRLTADKLGHALRLAGLKTARFTLVMTYSDGRSARRTVALQPPTSAFQPLADKAVSLFFDLYQRRVALRRLQLHVATPVVENGQRDLFEEKGRKKQEALETAIDRIRVRRQFDAVLSGSNVDRLVDSF